MQTVFWATVCTRQEIDCNPWAYQLISIILCCCTRGWHQVCATVAWMMSHWHDREVPATGTVLQDSDGRMDVKSAWQVFLSLCMSLSLEINVMHSDPIPTIACMYNIPGLLSYKTYWVPQMITYHMKSFICWHPWLPNLQ